MPSPRAPLRPSGVVTLLTDFGHRDPYVGLMKGVLLREAPGLRAIVDLTHEVEPQDVPAAGFLLARSLGWFPAGTIHLAVVDPGVGTGRGILVARVGSELLVAPDNGLLGPALAGDPAAEVRRVADPEAFRVGRSHTFHGRDVFSPLVARLAEGLDPAGLGPPVTLEERDPAADVVTTPRGELLGRVLWTDRFGNLVTNLGAERLAGDPARYEVLLGERRIPVARTYAEVSSGELLALIDSYDLLELAVRDGSAARALEMGRGDPVLLRPKNEDPA